MDETMHETNFLTRVVRKILQNFEEWKLKSSLGTRRYSHVDVTLLKDGTIQVTNYGQFTDDILHFSKQIFRDLTSTGVFTNNSLLATIYSRNESNDCQNTLDLRYVRKRLSLITSINDKNPISFAYQRNYLSYQLQHKLLLPDVEKFTKIVLNDIILLQRLNPNTKYTYHYDQKVIYKNHTSMDNDYRSCQVLAAALTNIVKQSVNIAFKENCHSMLKVDNSHQVESALMVKLLPLIHDNYIFSDDT